MTLEDKVSPDLLDRAASILEYSFEEICDAYEKRLLEIESPLVAQPETRGQLKAQALAVLEDVARVLRGAEPSPAPLEDRLSVDIGVARAREGVHAVESLRAVAALSESALEAVVENLPSSPTSRSEVAAVALVLQRTITEDLAREAISYGDFLLCKVHESHTDERRRISRELHDRVAHTLMVIFRSLELHEVHKNNDPSRAGRKLELARELTQEALGLIRDLSAELRYSSAGEGLEAALSNILYIIVPPEIESQLSIEGDESLVSPGIRDELFLVLREAIRNAAAHSEAREISVTLNITEDRVQASVRDDGRGFKKKTGSAPGTGLTSMKERVSLLGGTLDLSTVPGAGTVVSVWVPLPRVVR